MVPSGLMNAPSIFMRLMNGVFRLYLDRFILVFLNDILIYSRSIEEHEDPVRQVLQCLRENQLYANLAKSELFQTVVRYIGHVILGEGITVDPSKIQLIFDWSTPTNVGKVHSFWVLRDIIANMFRISPR